MRKTLGICVAASLALWLGGCGDDDSPKCIDCDEPDSATNTTNTDEPDASTDDSDTSEPDASSTSTEPVSSTGSTSSEPTLDAGSSEETRDSGATEDSGTGVEVDADVIEADGGSTAADAGDAGEEEGDADTSEDAEAPVGTPCDQACATAAELNCENPSCGICGIRGANAECTAEADAYLECIGASDPDEDFACTDDGPAFTSTDCDDPYFNAWLACAGF